MFAMNTRRLLVVAVVTVCSALGGNVALAAETALYQKTVATYPAPALEDVGGREYKALLDANKTKSAMNEAFPELWNAVKAGAAKRGFNVTEKEKNALKIEMSTKEYFDTKDQALWKAGYLVRISTKYKDGKPDDKVSVTVKAIQESALKALKTPLAVVGIDPDKVKTEAEENVGFVPGGKLGGYVEKGASFSVKPAQLGAMTLGDFGKFMPELLKLGLPAETALIVNKAYSYRIRPGEVVLPEVGPCGVSMEAWTIAEGGTPYLYDFSFGYGDVDFYAIAAAHAEGEKFMHQVVKEELKGFLAADSDNWGGSKVRKMMNRPVTTK
jgi:hypothetical protein